MSSCTIVDVVRLFHFPLASRRRDQTGLTRPTCPLGQHFSHLPRHAVLPCKGKLARLQQGGGVGASLTIHAFAVRSIQSDVRYTTQSMRRQERVSRTLSHRVSGRVICVLDGLRTRFGWARTTKSAASALCDNAADAHAFEAWVVVFGAPASGAGDISAFSYVTRREI